MLCRIGDEGIEAERLARVAAGFTDGPLVIDDQQVQEVRGLGGGRCRYRIGGQHVDFSWISCWAWAGESTSRTLASSAPPEKGLRNSNTSAAPPSPAASG